MKGLISSMMDDETYDSIVEDATVDCYDECEQIAGFCSILQDEVALPVSAIFVGAKLSTIGFTCDDSRVLANVKRDGIIADIDLRDIEITNTDNKSLDWIYAYQRWRKGL